MYTFEEAMCRYIPSINIGGKVLAVRVVSMGRISFEAGKLIPEEVSESIRSSSLGATIGCSL